MAIINKQYRTTYDVAMREQAKQQLAWLLKAVAQKEQGAASKTELGEKELDHRMVKLPVPSPKPAQATKIHTLRSLNQRSQQPESASQIRLLEFAIMERNIELVDLCIKCKATITEQTIKCLTRELEKDNMVHGYDFRLIQIRNRIQAQLNWDKRLQILSGMAIVMLPLVGIGITNISSILLYKDFLELSMNAILDNWSYIGALMALINGTKETLQHHQNDQLTIPKSQETKNFQTTFTILNRGILLSAYASFALAMVSHHLRGTLLTMAYSMEVFRESLQLYRIWMEGFSYPQQLKSTNDVGRHYGYYAHFAKTQVKIATNSANTVICYLWCFTPIAMHQTLTMYALSYLFKVSACKLINGAANQKIKQGEAAFFDEPYEKSLFDRSLDIVSVIHQECHKTQASLQGKQIIQETKLGIEETLHLGFIKPVIDLVEHFQKAQPSLARFMENTMDKVDSFFAPVTKTAPNTEQAPSKKPEQSHSQDFVQVRSGTNSNIYRLNT